MITTIFDQSYLFDLIRLQAGTYTDKHNYNNIVDNSKSISYNPKPSMIIKTPTKNNYNRKGKLTNS